MQQHVQKSTFALLKTNNYLRDIWFVSHRRM